MARQCQKGVSHWQAGIENAGRRKLRLAVKCRALR
nr:MAG TPA_asm: hypothetical protein [Caudoviricetes sp.]